MIRAYRKGKSKRKKKEENNNLQPNVNQHQSKYGRAVVRSLNGVLIDFNVFAVTGIRFHINTAKMLTQVFFKS